MDGYMDFNVVAKLAVRNNTTKHQDTHHPRYVIHAHVFSCRVTNESQ